MIRWEDLSENNPDGRWYNKNGRWDHMVIFTSAGGKKAERVIYQLVSSAGLPGIPSREGVDPVIFEIAQWDQKCMKLTILDENGEDCAMVRGIDAGTEHTFRYLYRRNVFMLYVDDLLVQVFVNMSPGNGRLGIFVQNASCEMNGITVHTMSV